MTLKHARPFNANVVEACGFDNTRYLRPAGYDHRPCNLRPIAARVIETCGFHLLNSQNTKATTGSSIHHLNGGHTRFSTVTTRSR